MAKGENIFKRKDGRWEARYVKSRTDSGKILYGYCYGKTYREAKEKMLRCRDCCITVKRPAPSVPPRFAQYCDEWLSLQKNKLKASSFQKYDTVLRKYIQPQLGGCALQELTTTRIQFFSDQLLEAGLSPKTTKDILVVLRSILKYVQHLFPSLVPPAEITYPKTPKTEMRVLSAAETAKLMDYLQKDPDPCKFGVLLAMVTGLRIGELCALQWENILLQEGVIRVNSTMQRIKDTAETSRAKTKVVTTLPKSSNSLRQIPLTSQAAALCEAMAPGNPAAYILTGTETYMEPRTLQYRFANYTRQCGLDGVHFHTLRHTFATRCVEVGFDIKSLSEILGHASTTITLERYVHSSMEQKRSNMRKLSTIGW